MAQPLHLRDRGAFLQRVTELLSVECEIGDGAVGSAALAAQAEFLSAPGLLDERRPLPSKWSRSNSRRRAAVETG
jgi:hypothetical protein